MLEYLTGWLLLVVFGLIVLHAPLTVIVGNNFPAIADIFKAWKEIFMVVAAILLIFAVTNQKKWRIFTSDKLFWLILTFGVLNLIYFAINPTIEGTVGLAINLRYILFFSLLYVFLKLYPNYRESFIKIGIIGATVVVGFALLQLFLPHDSLKHLGYGSSTIRPYTLVDENPEFVRFNSTLRGPNPLGAYAVIVLAGVLSLAISFGKSIWKSRVRYLHIFIGVGAIVALWFSYSRSALAAGVVAVAIILAVRYLRKISRIGWGIIAGLLIVSGLALYVFRDSSFVHNVILHDNPETGAEIDSNTAHVDSFVDAANFVIENPLGEGLGSTGSASLYTDTPTIVENQYLMVAHEIGWFGLAIYLAIFAILMVRLWHRRDNWFALAIFASGVGLALIGILLPVWADDTVSIIWWSAAAIALTEGVKDGKRKPTNKKAKRTA